MKLLVGLEKGDKGTPIEMANAIIRHYMDIPEECRCEDDINRARRELSELTEHLQVYLRHNRLCLALGGVPLDGRA
jgi:hypothetical protein